jgi:hypothetical protein
MRKGDPDSRMGAFVKSQIPSTNIQLISNNQSSKRLESFEYGHWTLFGIWDLEIGISRQ